MYALNVIITVQPISSIGHLAFVCLTFCFGGSDMGYGDWAIERSTYFILGRSFMEIYAKQKRYMQRNNSFILTIIFMFSVFLSAIVHRGG